MQEPLPVTLEHIKQVAELGLKHAQGSVFPIDRMEACLKHIIETVEKSNGTRTS